MHFRLWIVNVWDFFFFKRVTVQNIKYLEHTKKKNIYHLIQNGSTVAVCVCVCSYVFVL